MNWPIWSRNLALAAAAFFLMELNGGWPVAIWESSANKYAINCRFQSATALGGSFTDVQIAAVIFRASVESVVPPRALDVAAVIIGEDSMRVSSCALLKMEGWDSLSVLPVIIV
jgi:hypothetical protein